MLLEASDTYDQRVDSQVDALTSIRTNINRSIWTCGRNNRHFHFTTHVKHIFYSNKGGNDETKRHPNNPIRNTNNAV